MKDDETLQTFGTSKAALCLARLIHQLPPVQRRGCFRSIGTMLKHYFGGLRDIEDSILDDKLRETLLILYRNKYVEEIRTNPSQYLTPDIREYATNVVVTAVTKILRGE